MSYVVLVCNKDGGLYFVINSFGFEDLSNILKNQMNNGWEYSQNIKLLIRKEWKLLTPL